jgi:membrane-associated phospholipid phosphatase
MMDIIIKVVAEYFIIIPFIIVLGVFFKLKSKNERLYFAIELVIAGLAALLLARVSSMLWYDPRPFVMGHFTPLLAHANDNGFPSDHTLLASLIGWVTLTYSRKYGIITLIIALLIGTARVLAGVHHPVDILGSFIISGLATLIVMYVIKVIRIKKTAA